MSKLENFILAFGTNTGSCRGSCACGKVFYNPNEEAWDFEDGELESLENDDEAIAIDYAVSYVSLGGVEYVAECLCWRKKAKQVMQFIDFHDIQIVDYLKKEKKRKLDDANRVNIGELDNG